MAKNAQKKQDTPVTLKDEEEYRKKIHLSNRLEPKKLADPIPHAKDQGSSDYVL